MAGRLQKSFAGVIGPLVTKKAKNRVKGSKASDEHHFHLPANGHLKSQGSVKLDCRIQPYWTLGERLSVPAFCVQDVGPDMGPSTNKQTDTFFQPFSPFSLTPCAFLYTGKDKKFRCMCSIVQVLILLPSLDCNIHLNYICPH